MIQTIDPVRRWLLHESRSDYAQRMVTAFLLITGPGAWAADVLLARHRWHRPARPAVVGGLILPSPEASLCRPRPVRLIGG